MKYIIDLLPYIEQGNITSSGNEESTKRIRTSIYIPNPYTSIKNITLQINNGIQVDLLGYSSDQASSIIFDLYWFDTPHDFDISSYTTANYYRAVFKFADNADIVPNDITECKLIINSTWYIYNNNINVDCVKPILFFRNPLPISAWRIQENQNNGFPYRGSFLPIEEMGAFANAKKLKRVSIPKTVKKIGKFAFRNTQLTSVTIARDCTYYDTSFPEGCVVNFYPD
jgi:hypothetical protein